LKRNCRIPAPPRPTRAGSPPTSAHRSIPAPICEKKAPSSTPDRGYLAAPVFYTIISADKSGLSRSTAAACARLLPQARRLRAFASHSPETCSRQGTLRFPIVESALLNYDRRSVLFVCLHGLSRCVVVTRRPPPPKARPFELSPTRLVYYVMTSPR
jgi:hypothetical protein